MLGQDGLPCDPVRGAGNPLMGVAFGCALFCYNIYGEYFDIEWMRKRENLDESHRTEEREREEDEND